MIQTYTQGITMITHRIIAVLLAAISMNTMRAMDMDEFGHNVAIGSAAGITEVTVNQPLITIKNALQMHGEKTKKAKVAGNQPIAFNIKEIMNRKTLYKGYGMNVACMGPTTAVQIGANKGLEAVIGGDSGIERAERAVAAGAISALVAAPAELVVLTQFNTKQPALAAIKQLQKEAGARVWLRGAPIMAVREGLFTYAYMEAFSHVKNGLQKLAHKVVTEKHKDVVEVAAVVSAGAATGIVTAIATHPADTIKTMMQADYAKKQYKHIGHAIKGIYNANGLKGYYNGVTPRAVRAGLAIPMVYGVMKLLSTPDTKSDEHQ